MQKFRIIGISLLVLMFLASCATLGTKPWADRTQDEKLLYFLGVYNTQFLDTMRIANKPIRTDTENKIVRLKKEILKKMDIVLSIYMNTVTAGNVPSKEDELKLFAFIDEMVKIK